MSVSILYAILQLFFANFLILLNDIFEIIDLSRSLGQVLRSILKAFCLVSVITST